MKAFITMAMALPALALAGCATSSGGPVQVTRFHFGAPVVTGTLAVEPMAGGSPASLEFKTYAAAVQTELLDEPWAPCSDQMGVIRMRGRKLRRGFGEGATSVMLEVPVLGRDIPQKRIERPIIIDQALIEEPRVPVVQDVADVEDDGTRPGTHRVINPGAP